MRGVTRCAKTGVARGVQADSAQWFDYSPRVNASAPLTAGAAATWLDKYAAMLSAVHDAVSRGAGERAPLHAWLRARLGSLGHRQRLGRHDLRCEH